MSAPRRTLPKAYLRLDPNIDSHPDPATMVLLMVWANRQKQRGRFRHLDQLRRIIGRRQVNGAVERGDLIELSQGVFYLQGWDEWQEGDLTVGERVRRVRERRGKPEAELATSERYTSVSGSASTSEALGRKGVRADKVPPPPGPPQGGPAPVQTSARLKADIEWLSAQGALLGLGYRFDRHARARLRERLRSGEPREKILEEWQRTVRELEATELLDNGENSRE